MCFSEILAMPTFYGPRKSTRAMWTQEQLDRAIKAVQIEHLPVRQAAWENNIPEKTLRNRLATGNFLKGRLGQPSHLGPDAERKLVEHVRKLQLAGFAPTRKHLRKIAYNLAKSMGLKNKFNEKKEIAGQDWYKSFMKRNPALSLRKAEGISNARANGMSVTEVDNYFELLKNTLVENDLINKPGNIYNMDESGLQLNNEPGQVVAIKGTKDVHVRKSTERGETVTVIACCNAEGTFLPAYCIFKGVNKQQVWLEKMPPGSVIQMRKESAYVDSHLFMDWLENHFIPRKTAGKCLLILDGHGAHINSPEMLQKAADNDVILLCLPSHTTHYLQPLDRAFFGPLKAYFRNYCDEWGVANPNKKLERRHFGELLSKAWSRAATVEIGAAGFRATGIFPFSRSVIPEHAFLNVIQSEATQSYDPQDSETNSDTQQTTNFSTQPTPSTSSLTEETEKLTPTKLLHKVSPVPNPGPSKKTARKQSATILTDSKIIAAKKEKKMQMEKKKRKTEERKINAEMKKNEKKPVPSKKKSAKKRLWESSSDDEHEEPVLIDSSDGGESFNENECVECLEDYGETTSQSDWIKCKHCNRWLHESCTVYEDKCSLCGRLENREKKLKIVK